jgi:hypothetical protein
MEGGKVWGSLGHVWAVWGIKIGDFGVFWRIEFFAPTDRRAFIHAVSQGKTTF